MGLFQLSGFIGATLSIFFGGKLIDMISKRRTRFHTGRREPEYRLIAFGIPALIGPLGVLLFGLTIIEKKLWFAPAVGNAMQGFSLTFVSNIVAIYVVDSYVSLASEAMVTMFVIKGIVSSILLFYTTEWSQAAGASNVFGEMVGIQYFFCLFVIIFFLNGKRMRVSTARYGPLKWAIERE